MERPADLPDFRQPPLDEVLMGIQFATPAGYQQIKAGEIWALYRDNFPLVQELPALAPYFETFGQPGLPLNFGLVVGAQHDRFWFISRDGDQIIQFQNDRFLRNWRKVVGLNNVYPRYESIVESFKIEAEKLNNYFVSISGQSLNINQCEISYINHIVPKAPGKLDPSAWLEFLRFGAFPPEDFSASFRRRINGTDGNPIGRLSIDAATGARPDGQEIVILTITARAVPSEPSLKSSLEFFALGRDMIVRSFTEATTDSAHKIWERIR